MVKIREVIHRLDPYIPGKSIKEIAEKYSLKKEDIIKLGSNENPLGPSPLAVEAIKNEVKLISQYPETGLKDLKEEIAEYSGVSSDEVIIGGDGADEIIDLLGKTFLDPDCEFIVPIPSYMYYEFNLRNHGARPVYARWDVEANQLDVASVLESISEKTRLIFLCTPNNPTGGLINKNDIGIVLNSTDALVVVDEAYFEFANINNVELLSVYENLFILRTFSKVMGLAGLRIGYGLSNPKIIDYMHRVKPPFSLTNLSHTAALATLKDRAYLEKSAQISIESRELLWTELSKIDEIRVFESKANYLLIDIRNTNLNSSEMTEELLKKGIIVRDCISFKGLDEYWIRVSVGTIEQDKKFIKVFKGIIERNK